MKKLGKWAAFVVIAAVLIAILAVSYVVLELPDVGKPENIKIALTPQRIARGKYLATNVALCMDCHNSDGSGGIKFNADDGGLPGTMYSYNITPYVLGNWTDGEILRAITTGEAKDGSPLFPFMPWSRFANMSREDLYSIIAYLRTLKPVVAGPYPVHKLDFPNNIIVHLMPQKAAFGEVPPLSDTVKYGAYLVNAASCTACHTQMDKGNPIPGMEFAGGVKFNMGDKIVTTQNITPDKNTGIGNWTGDMFVKYFKTRGTPASLKAVESPMPWDKYSCMNDTDLKAIFAYLHTQKPVVNKVVN